MGDVIRFPAQTRPEPQHRATRPLLWREAVGHELRRERIRQDRTLADVAEVAGISTQYLSEVERGRKEPSSELLGAICGALDVPLSRVLADAAEQMLHTERAEADRTVANIDVATKVVIPQHLAMAVA